MYGGNVDKLVLGTVNASWKKEVSGDALALKISQSDLSDFLPHIVTFFTEVAPYLVLSFCEKHGIEKSALLKTYDALKALTGEQNISLESALGGLAKAA